MIGELLRRKSCAPVAIGILSAWMLWGWADADPNKTGDQARKIDLSGRRGGIGIVDLKTMRAEFAPQGAWREIVLSVDERKKSFMTLTRLDADTAELRTRSFDGGIAQSRRLPMSLFSKTCTDSWFAPEYRTPGLSYRMTCPIAVSPRENYIIYHDCVTHNVASINLDNLTSRYVMPHVQNCEIRWIADNEALLSLGPNRVLLDCAKAFALVTLPGNELHMLNHAVNPFVTSLSTDRRYLAFCETTSEVASYRPATDEKRTIRRISILDLQTRTSLPAVNLAEKMTASNVSWSPDGQSLAYASIPANLKKSNLSPTISIVDLKATQIAPVASLAKNASVLGLWWSPDGARLVYSCVVKTTDAEGEIDVYAIGDKQNKTLKTFPAQEEGLAASVVFSNNTRLSIALATPYRLTVFPLDIATGKEGPASSILSVGKKQLIDGGAKALCEFGE